MANGSTDINNNVKNWIPVQKLKNGIIYKEYAGGTYLVSAVYPVEPALLNSMLLVWDHGDGKSQIWPSAEQVGQAEDSSDIIQVVVQPFNWQQQFFQPRSLLLKRESTKISADEFLISYVEMDKKTFPYIDFSSVDEKSVEAELTYFKIHITRSVTEGEQSQMVVVLSTSMQSMLLDQTSWVSRTLEFDLVWIQNFLEFVYNLHDKINENKHGLNDSNFQNGGLELSSVDREDSFLSTRGSLPTNYHPGGSFGTAPPPKLSDQFWSSPGEAKFRLRGPNYLNDKIKIPAQKPRYELQAMELVKMKQVVPHLSRFVPCVTESTAPFMFVLTLMLPFSGDQLGAVIVFAADQKPSEHVEAGMHPFDLCMARFLSGDDEVKSSKLKLIPGVVEGNFIVKQAVGQTPVILGKKLATSYHRGPNYIEAQFDIGSNQTAATITNIAANATKTLVLDMALLLEGHTDSELPEHLIGSVRIKRLDLKQAIPIDVQNDNFQKSVSESVLSQKNSRNPDLKNFSKSATNSRNTIA